MELIDLRNEIVSNVKSNLYIFTGPEVKVMDVYLEMICKMYGYEKYRPEDIKEVIKKTKNINNFSKKSIYILRDDVEFTKQEEAWKNIDSLIGNNVVILIYSSIDKRGKFYKYWKDKIVTFEKLSEVQLNKYVLKELGNEFNSQSRYLINICENDYSRILLECDKIKTYAKLLNINYVESFRELLKSGIIHIPVGDIIFKFTDAIMKRNVKDCFELWEKLKTIQESPIKVLSILYNNMRNTLIVQSIPNPNTQNTGLSGWNIKCSKEFCGYYSTIELLQNVKTVRDIEKGIKEGRYEQSLAIDLLLVNVL